MECPEASFCPFRTIEPVKDIYTSARNFCDHFQGHPTSFCAGGTVMNITTSGAKYKRKMFFQLTVHLCNRGKIEQSDYSAIKSLGT